MTERKKEFLKDLCCRLPYNTMVLTCGCGTTRKIKLDYQVYYLAEQGIFRIMPYLFPMSSMTEEQKSRIEFYAFMKEYHKIVELYNENHIDYRGFIEKGLSIDATNLNIY